MISLRTQLAIWFLLLSGICALGMGSHGVPPFFGAPKTADTDSIIETSTAMGLSSATVTRSSLNFGLNASNRVIVVSVAWQSGGTRQISSITIGGTTATVAEDCTASGAAFAGGAVFYATPSGTTGQSVVMTWSNTITAYSYAAYRLLPNVSIPSGGTIGSCNAATSTYTFNVVKGGSFFAPNRIQSATGAIVYSGTDTLATDASIVVSTNTLAVGSALTSETSTGRTIKFNPTPGSTSSAGVVAQWF